MNVLKSNINRGYMIVKEKKSQIKFSNKIFLFVKENVSMSNIMFNVFVTLHIADIAHGF